MIATKSPVGVSNLQIMRALLAKDWRLFRLPMIGLLVVAAICYGLSGVAALARHSDKLPSQDALFPASIFAAILTALVASAFGGVAIAGERSDRTADFLALLPVTRRQIIFSKLLVGGLAVGTWETVHVAVGLAVLVQAHGGCVYPQGYWAQALGWLIGCTVSFFGVAWLLSTFTTSAAISACVSLAIPLGTTLLIDLNVDGRWSVPAITGSTMLPVGLASLIAGTIYYLRRVAP